jgi:D-3-phosphoglycerate dehydrogenase
MNPPPRVVITDWSFPDLSVEEGILKPAGCDVVGRQCKTPNELVSLVAEADCVITQFARLTAAVITAMRRARAIVRYGIGVDNIDLDAAFSRGVPVCNVPDYCIDEVADHTLAFMLGLTRQVATYDRHVHAGRWGLAVPLDRLKSLHELTVGVVGFGRIGREVARRVLAFKVVRVLVFDPFLEPDEIVNARCEPATFEDLLEGADLLTLHCPSTPTTRRLMNRETFARLKRGALFVNVARGDLVDTDALVESLRRGDLAGAALDVCDPEPIPAGHPLLELPNVILAPHIASASVPAVRKLRETVAGIALKAVRGEPLPNIVNGIDRNAPPSPLASDARGRGSG